MTVTFAYPERYSESTLAAELSTRLAGKSASGATLAKPVTGGRTLAVVWVEAGSEVMVYLDSVKIKITGTVIAVSIDLESDQTGRTPLIVTLALGGPSDPAGMLAVTDDLPRGNGILAARWGSAVTAAVWGALLSLLQDYATERRLAASGFAAGAGVLRLIAAESILVNLAGARA
jgi:hypothetical protein